jgi:hypothetical protein
MPKERAKAEKMVPAGGSKSDRDKVVDAVAADLRGGDDALPRGVGFVQRIVEVPCPSGKHPRCVLTFRGYKMSCMFCIPCEQGWTEANAHPALRDLHTDKHG